MRSARNVFVFVALLGAATLSIAKVTTDHDNSVDFSKYRTYAWIAGTPAPNPLSEKRIRAALERELQASGLELVEESPDLYVASHATKSTQQHISVDRYGYGNGRYHSSWGTTSARVHDIPIGTLVVDLIDAESKPLIWRAEGTETLSNKPEKNEKKINTVTAKMFKNYPPAEKK